MKGLSCLCIVLLYNCFFIMACSDNDNQNTNTPDNPRPFVISNLVVQDIGESGNASDIRIAFDMVSDESLLDEYRVYLVKTENAAGFNLEAALSISEMNYSSIDKSGSDINTTLDADTKDTDGETIIENISYSVYAVAVDLDFTSNNLDGISGPVLITLESEEVLRTYNVASVNSNFSASGGLLLGSDSSIYVADFGTGAENGTTILKFTPDGSSFEEFADGLLGPTGGAFDSQGNLYWSSYSADMVHKIDEAGNVSNFASIPGPVAIAVDPSDNLYIAACNSNDVRMITPTGEVSIFATSNQFNCVNGLAFDSSGDLYACNFEDGRIFKIEEDATVSLFTRISSGSSVNIATSEGHIYITGRNAHRIYKVSIADGSVETLAGTGNRGNVDGNARQAEFSFPNGIAVGQDDRIYVNDVDPDSGFNNNGPNFNPNILRIISFED